MAIDTAQKELKPVNLKKAFVWAGVLVALDAFLLNQGVLSALVGAWMLLVSLPRSAFNKSPEQRNRRFARIAIFLGAVMLVFGLNSANNQIARKRAETLITAIKAFKLKNQRYPEKLSELVPDFIKYLPTAKYTLSFNSFHYVSGPESHSLFYVEMPPFGRPTYSFERGSWGYLD